MARINADPAVRVSHGAKTSEFREKWLAELRCDIADFIGAAEIVLHKWEQFNELPRKTEEEVTELDIRRAE